MIVLALACGILAISNIVQRLECERHRREASERTECGTATRQ
jgi:hypothetical protein